MCKQWRKVDVCCLQEDGEGRELDLLVSKIGDVSSGGLEKMME